MEERNTNRLVNPYNFIPFGKGPVRVPLAETYARPAALKSGFLDVTITAKTPLLIPDSSRVTKEMVQKTNIKGTTTVEHRHYPFMVVDGQPMIPGSSLHGMLRSVYEAATDSCLPILRDNNAAFAMRVPLSGGFRQRGILEYDPAGKRWLLYPAAVKKSVLLQYRRYSEAFEGSGYVLNRNLGLSYNKQPLRNGSRVTVDGNPTWLQCNMPVATAQPCKPGEVKKDAVYKLAFVVKSEQTPLFVWEGKAAREPYRAVLDSCAYDPKMDDDNLRKQGKVTVTHQQLAEELRNARMNGGAVPVWYLKTNHNGMDEYHLSASAIGRVRQSRSWAEVMGNHASCDRLDALCSACALFGTAKGTGKDGTGVKGRIRVTDALPTGAGVRLLPERTLAILGEPKYSAYEFYLNQPTDGSGNKADYWNYTFYGMKTTGLNDVPMMEYRDYDSSVRGRKFYWHSLPSERNAFKNNQNSTMEPAAAGSTFAARIYFDAITEEQYKQLLWVLTFGENAVNSKLQHKLGHGRPLGYGSVKLTVTGGAFRTVTADENGLPVYSMTPVQVGATVQNPFDPQAEHIRSLLKMADADAVGKNPVSYPYASQKEKKPAIYSWFSMNHEKVSEMALLPRVLDEDITLCGDLPGGYQGKRNNATNNWKNIPAPVNLNENKAENPPRGGRFDPHRVSVPKARKMHKANCTYCGCEIEVPFEPAPGKGVYCKQHLKTRNL